MKKKDPIAIVTENSGQMKFIFPDNEKGKALEIIEGSNKKAKEKKLLPSDIPISISVTEFFA